MNSAASSCGMFRRSAIPNGERPYTIPKLTIFAFERMPGSIWPGADRGEHARVRREARLAAPLLGQAEFLEEDLRELLRRADRELLAGHVPDLALQLVRPAPDLDGDLPDLRHVQSDPGTLHLRQ